MTATAYSSSPSAWLVALQHAVSAGSDSLPSSSPQGLQQAHAIADRFDLPRHVLPGLLTTPNYASYVTRMLSKPAQPLPALPPRHTSHRASTAATTSATTFASGTLCASAASTQASVQPPQPQPGSPQYVEQLQRIREVCVQAQVDYSLIDGMLASASAACAGAAAPARLASISTVNRVPDAGLLHNMGALQVAQAASSVAGEQVAEAVRGEREVLAPLRESSVPLPRGLGSLESLEDFQAEQLLLRTDDGATAVFAADDDAFMMRDASLGGELAWAP
jgi:hypothetical protein